MKDRGRCFEGHGKIKKLSDLTIVELELDVSILH